MCFQAKNVLSYSITIAMFSLFIKILSISFQTLTLNEEMKRDSEDSIMPVLLFLCK